MNVEELREAARMADEIVDLARFRRKVASWSTMVVSFAVVATAMDGEGKGTEATVAMAVDAAFLKELVAGREKELKAALARYGVDSGP